MGAIAVIFAAIPLLNWISWLFWIPSLVCAIVGLVKKGVKKGTAWAGLILSVVAILFEFVLTPLVFVYWWAACL